MVPGQSLLREEFEAVKAKAFAKTLIGAMRETMAVGTTHA
jgi:hypothetical protein